ncbi:MAG TPA: hypothetical protein VHN14_28635 [Kofleriaceae bacterium]|jgi:hypothetical protein|nr:hypothetical protein [Kofleriaceae bacterium]
MGENILRRAPANSPPQQAERSTAEIAVQRRSEPVRDPADDELEPELEFVAGLPKFRPDATPIPWDGKSSPRLAHTLRRSLASDAVPGLALADVATRPIMMLPELPPVEAPRNLPPIEVLQPLSPLVQAPRTLPPVFVGPPKRPPAPRTTRDRLALPAMLVVLALGAVAFFLLYTGTR